MMKADYLRQELLKRRVLSTLLLASIIVNVFVSLALAKKVTPESSTEVAAKNDTDTYMYSEHNVSESIEGVKNNGPMLQLLSYSSDVTPSGKIDIENKDGIELLERLVMTEAGGEIYEGQVAVANVVCNRLRSTNYPNNVYAVIFQPGQFEPALTGKIFKVVPTDSVKKAVRECLEGKSVVADDVLYFLNPKLAKDLTIPKTKTFVQKIGNHYFYKD